MADLSVEDFLGHQTSSGGGGGKFLRGWKKRQPPSVSIWLHTRVMFSSLWIHNVPRVVERKNRDTNETKIEIWGNNWNCWEQESVLKERGRDYNTGERDVPIQICPMCKMIEWVRRAIRQKALSPVDPIFRFVTPDGSDERIIHAAGLFNGLEDESTEVERKAAKINLKDAWRENANSKCQYLFCVVDHDHPEDGVQIAIETSLLGDKMKAAMRRLRKKNGEQSNWNPLATPYAFTWEHHKGAKTFNETYEADDAPRLQLTPDIEALITGDAPDLTRIKAPGRVRELRDQLERYALIEMPFDEFFAAAEAQDKGREDDDTDFPFGANEGGDDSIELNTAAVEKGRQQIDQALDAVKTQVQQPAPKPEPQVQQPAPKQQTAPAPEPKPAAAEAQQPAPNAPTPGGRRKKVDVKPPVEEVFIDCDDCGNKMREDEEKCSKCGATYEVDEATKAKYANAKPMPGPDAGTHGDKINW